MRSIRQHRENWGHRYTMGPCLQQAELVAYSSTEQIVPSTQTPESAVIPKTPSSCGRGWLGADQDQVVLTMLSYHESLSLQSYVKTRPVLRIALSRSVTFAEGNDNAENSKRQCGSRDKWREMNDRRLIFRHSVRSMSDESCCMVAEAPSALR